MHVGTYAFVDLVQLRLHVLSVLVVLFHKHVDTAQVLVAGSDEVQGTAVQHPDLACGAVGAELFRVSSEESPTFTFCGFDVF